MVFHNFEEMAAGLAGMSPKHVVVAAPHDGHTFEAMQMANEHGNLTFTLCGIKEKMEKGAAEAGFDLSTVECIYVNEDAEAASLAVALVDEGKGDLVLKGTLSTEILLRVIVRTENEKFGKVGISHVSLVEIPAYHKLFGITDGGMTPHPTFEEKEMILKNALDLFHTMGYEQPIVCCMTATERVSHRMVETSDAEQMTKNAAEGKYGNCIVGGPMAFDLAFSQECADIKGYKSPVTGNFDVILTPDINSGNILTKSMVHTSNGKMAGCILGARMPIALTSRGAKSEEKYLSLLMALMAAGDK
ncbi:MAG: phosphate butyryltransferase [Clostridiales bacterium]|nr:phosphate butyryltransferase [Clostridiales bacterium]